MTLHTYTEKGRKKGFYKKKTYHRCWWRYDGAQTNELLDVLGSIHIGVDTVSRDLAAYLNRSRGPGRPGKNPSDLAKAVLLQQYEEVANRPLEGALFLCGEKLGLVSGPGYKDVERAYSNPDVTVILLGLFELTVKAVRDEREFSVDGTGLSTSMKDNWQRYLSKQSKQVKQGKEGGERRYSIFEKLVCVVGHRYGLISAYRLLESMHGHESPALKPCLEKVVERHGGLDLVCGDSAYFSRDNCTLVRDLGGVPRFYPKKNATLKSQGSKEYQEMLLAFVNDPQEWLRDYFKKAASEWTFSSLKRRCLVPLRRKIAGRRKLEVVARIVVYNLIRLSYARWMKDLPTPLQTHLKPLAR